jgi:nicotinate dehydrogenase subunit A
VDRAPLEPVLAEPVEVDDVEVALTVNGVPVVLRGDPDTPLLYPLRNDLGLTGTMFGCGAGECGACFVLLDGRPVPSCDTPLLSIAGRSVVTVEGLAGDGDGLSALQQAVLDEQAAQCGYCLSGILVSGTALLAENPAPAEDEVRRALDRNLCRCGSHPRMVAAILAAARSRAV